MPNIHQIITEDPLTLLMVVPVVVLVAVYFAFDINLAEKDPDFAPKRNVLP